MPALNKSAAAATATVLFYGYGFTVKWLNDFKPGFVVSFPSLSSSSSSLCRVMWLVPSGSSSCRRKCWKMFNIPGVFFLYFCLSTVNMFIIKFIFFFSTVHSEYVHYIILTMTRFEVRTYGKGSNWCALLHGGLLFTIILVYCPFATRQWPIYIGKFSL